MTLGQLLQFFSWAVPLYEVLSFPPLAYSVPDLVNSKLGWTALDVVRRCCVQLFSILWFIRRPGEGGPNPVHSCTTQHYSLMFSYCSIGFTHVPGVNSAQNM